MPYKDPEKKRAYNKQYRAEHLETIRENERRWKKANAEKVRASCRRASAKWKRLNPEKAKESRHRTYLRQDAEHRRRVAAEWRAKNPEKMAQYKQRMLKRQKAQRRGIGRESVLAYHRAYVAAHKERIIAQNKESARRRRAENPEAYRLERRDIELKRQYGITHADYELMLAAQGGRCAICRSSNPQTPTNARHLFCIDHDHATGKVRGLLCFSCNVGLGKFKDDPALMMKAIEYLRAAAVVVKLPTSQVI